MINLEVQICLVSVKLLISKAVISNNNKGREHLLEIRV